jgi:hypothetical protein
MKFNDKIKALMENFDSEDDLGVSEETFLSFIEDVILNLAEFTDTDKEDYNIDVEEDGHIIVDFGDEVECSFILEDEATHMDVILRHDETGNHLDRRIEIDDSDVTAEKVAELLKDFNDKFANDIIYFNRHI